MNTDELNERLEKLELRCAWQDEQIEAFNRTVAHLQAALNNQQAQLRFLYERLPENSSIEQNTRLEQMQEDIPPHY